MNINNSQIVANLAFSTFFVMGDRHNIFYLHSFLKNRIHLENHTIDYVIKLTVICMMPHAANGKKLNLFIKQKICRKKSGQSCTVFGREKRAYRIAQLCPLNIEDMKSKQLQKFHRKIAPTKQKCQHRAFRILEIFTLSCFFPSVEHNYSKNRQIDFSVSDHSDLMSQSENIFCIC